MTDIILALISGASDLIGNIFRLVGRTPTEDLTPEIEQELSNLQIQMEMLNHQQARLDEAVTRVED